MKTFSSQINIAIGYIILLLVFSGATSKDNFKLYLASLERLEMPLTLNSKYKLKEDRSKNYNRALYKRFKYRWAYRPYGKLFDKDSAAATIDLVAGDGIAPVLMTFDQDGRKQDSLSLFKKVGRDMGYESNVYVLINMNREILITDSVKRWSFNKEKNNIIPGTEKLTVSTSSYLIDKKGKIKKIKD